MSTPALVLVAHGTRSARGVEMIAELAEAVALELGASQTGVGAAFGAASAPSAPQVRTAFVDVLGPSPSEVLGTLDPVPAVVVPAFLASGYHVYQDVPREVAASAHAAVAVTHAMGPDPALAHVMHLRLRAAGWQPGDAVVFAAAGSSDARARRDVQRAATLLSDRLGTPAHLAYIATGEPKVPEVVAAVRDSGAQRVFIASYLLAHGLFHQRLHDAGADGVAEPIGVHPAVVALIADRYRVAAHRLSTVRAA